MAEPKAVETCRWARPTIRVPYPHWTEAEDKPWTCMRDEAPRPLEDTDVCRECPRWQPHRVDAAELPPK